MRVAVWASIGRPGGPRLTGCVLGWAGRGCPAGGDRAWRQDEEELGSIDLNLVADSSCLKGDLKLDVPNGA